MMNVVSSADDMWTTVDCDRCPRRRPNDAFCGECVVAFIAGRDDDDALVIDVYEERALRALDAGGLLAEVVDRCPIPAGRRVMIAAHRCLAS